MTDVGKRPAFESPAALVQPAVGDAAMRRPITTTVGAALVMLRVVAGVIWLISLSLMWDELFVAAVDEGSAQLTESELEEASQLTLVIVLGVLGFVLVVDLVLAVLTYLGLNWPRIVVMIVSTLSITGSFVTWWVGDQEITLQTTFLTLALDILIMLALSSRSARAYARRPRVRRSVRAAG